MYICADKQFERKNLLFKEEDEKIDHADSKLTVLYVCLQHHEGEGKHDG